MALRAGTDGPLFTSPDGSIVINHDENTIEAVGGGGGGITEVIAGDGLDGGGSGPVVSLEVLENGDGSIVSGPSGIGVGVLATDAQHGNRGGGTTHPDAVAGGASGFISGANQTKLNGIEALADVTDFANVSAALAAATADVSVNSRKLTNGAEPTNPQDFATKNYGDTRLQLVQRLGASAAPNNTGDRFLVNDWASANSTAESGGQFVFDYACTVLSLRLKPAGSVAGLTANIVYAFRVNGVDSSIVFTGTAGNGYAGAATGTVSVSVGDFGSLRTTQATAEVASAMSPRATLTGRSSA